MTLPINQLKLSAVVNTVASDEPQSQAKFVLKQENLTDCIEDTAANYAYNHPEHYLIDSTIFQSVLFEALTERIEELIEDFSTNPQNYLKANHEKELDEIAYLYTIDEF